MQTRKNLWIGLVILISLSLIPTNVTATDDGLKLPSEMVRIEVFDGTESYFSTTLSNVPAGYDVANGTYLGWCVDVRTQLERSPATHEVMLYSSINSSEFADERWDMINYILNHKPEQTTAEDIQQAMWYFVNMNASYTPTRNGAWTIINDTLQNGNGFIPTQGQIIAVIVNPLILFPAKPEVQVNIIEVTLPTRAQLAIAATVSSTEIYSGGTATIKVSVTSGGTGIAGASVNLTSDNGGSFSPVIDYANGTYTSTFTAPEITVQTPCLITVSASKTEFLSASGQTQVTVQPLILNIYVKDVNNNSLADVTVVSTSQPSGQTSISGTTDANGLTRFSGILKGSYTIKASKTGYEDKTWTVSITAGQVTTETVTLSKPAEFPWIMVIAGVIVAVILIVVVFLLKMKKPKPK